MINYLLIFIVLLMFGFGNRQVLHNTINPTNSTWINTLNKIEFPLMHDSLLNVYFKYNQLVNGYEVTGRWMLFDAHSETGEAIINFHHVERGQSFHYTESIYRNFDMDEITFSDGFKGYQDGDVYYLDYKIHDNPDSYKDSPLSYYAPFQFYDVDFDGNDELIINGCDLLKGGNSYRVYKIIDNSIQLMDSLPFNRLNNDVEFDIENKSMRLYGIEGIFDSSLVVFSKHSTTIRNKVIPLNLSETTSGNILEEYYKQDKTNFRLDSIYQYFNQELGYTYIIIDDELTLVEQKIIAN